MLLNNNNEESQSLLNAYESEVNPPRYHIYRGNDSINWVTWLSRCIRSALSIKNVRQFSIEYIGTFFLVFSVAASINSASGVQAYAVGLGLVGLVYLTGGGQLNPAVSMGVCICKRISIIQCASNIFAQILGGLSAGIVCFLLFNNWTNVGYPYTNRVDYSIMSACLFELFGAFILQYVILNTTCAKDKNSYYGLAVGVLILALALTGGTISGACFNPAVSMLTLLHGEYADFWLYVACSISGCTIASLLYPVYNPDSTSNQANGANSKANVNSEDSSYVALFSGGPPSCFGLRDKYWMLRCGVVELVGSFYIALIMCTCKPCNTTDAMATVNYAMAMFGVVTALVYSGCEVSGAHYNPLITISVTLFDYAQPLIMPGVVTAHEMSSKAFALDMYMGLYYMGAQALGIIGALCVGSIINGSWDRLNGISPTEISNTSTSDESTTISVFIAEALYSLCYVLVYLVSIKCDRQSSMFVKSNVFYGFAIGFVILSANLTIGNMSNCILNPFYVLCIEYIQHNWKSNELLWQYILGELVGSALALFLFCLWYDIIEFNYTPLW